MEKALLLSQSIDFYKRIIEDIEEAIDPNKKTFKINFCIKCENCNSKVISVDSDKTDIDIIDTAGRMSLLFILEVYKKKLERLELQYANL